MIECRGVSFSYDGAVSALDGVDLNIEDGEFFCILGGNGSGKSTFAKHLNALLQPDAGLGILKGEILRIPPKEGLKIPHMGWNSIEIKPQAKLFKDIPNQSYVYFVHSYYLKAQDEQIVAASTEYSTHIHASVESGNVFACQFHPEKSSDIGLQILKNFSEL